MMLGGNATTDAGGTFTIRNVPPGTYKLLAQTTRDTQTARGTVLEIATQTGHARRRRRREPRAHDVDGLDDRPER